MAPPPNSNNNNSNSNNNNNNNSNSKPVISDKNDCTENPDSPHCKQLREEIQNANATAKEFKKDVDALSLVNRLLATSVNMQADVLMGKQLDYDEGDLKEIMEFNPMSGLNPFTKNYRFSFLDEDKDPRKIMDRLMNKGTSREAVQEVFRYVDGTSGKYISPSYGKESSNPAMLTFQPY